jgi:hypothetical protein
VITQPERQEEARLWFGDMVLKLRGAFEQIAALPDESSIDPQGGGQAASH